MSATHAAVHISERNTTNPGIFPGSVPFFALQLTTFRQNIHWIKYMTTKTESTIMTISRITPWISEESMEPVFLWAPTTTKYTEMTSPTASTMQAMRNFRTIMTLASAYPPIGN